MALVFDPPSWSTPESDGAGGPVRLTTMSTPVDELTRANQRPSELVYSQPPSHAPSFTSASVLPEVGW